MLLTLLAIYNLAKLFAKSCLSLEESKLSNGSKPEIG